MRKESGGTKIYCPFCGEVHECRAKTSGEQRWFSPIHPDIQWFKRERTCLSCGNKFVTVELDEEVLEELMQLRFALGEIKKNAEQYLKESRAASHTLEKLS